MTSVPEKATIPIRDKAIIPIKEKAAIPVIARRKLLTSGGSTVVSVPTEWLRQFSLKEGDDVLVIANGSLKIIPDDKETIEKLHQALEKAELK